MSNRVNNKSLSRLTQSDPVSRRQPPHKRQLSIGGKGPSQPRTPSPLMKCFFSRSFEELLLRTVSSGGVHNKSKDDSELRIVIDLDSQGPMNFIQLLKERDSNFSVKQPINIELTGTLTNSEDHQQLLRAFSDKEHFPYLECLTIYDVAAGEEVILPGFPQIKTLQIGTNNRKNIELILGEMPNLEELKLPAYCPRLGNDKLPNIIMPDDLPNLTTLRFLEHVEFDPQLCRYPELKILQINHLKCNISVPGYIEEIIVKKRSF